MSKYCVVCGAELSDDTVYCNECGAKTPGTDDAADSVRNTVAASQNYGAPAEQMYPAVSTIAFFGLILLFSIPLIGFIASIVLAFVPQNKNLKSFARAALIWMLIGMVVSGLIFWGIFILATEHLDAWVENNPIFSNPEFWDIVEDYADGSLEIPSNKEELQGFLETLPEDYEDYLDSIPEDIYDEIPVN